MLSLNVHCDSIVEKLWVEVFDPGAVSRAEFSCIKHWNEPSNTVHVSIEDVLVCVWSHRGSPDANHGAMKYSVTKATHELQLPQ